MYSQTERFARLVSAEGAAGAHDVVVVDMDGDGRPDIVMMGDARTKLNSLRWHKIPDNPRQPWQAHHIGPGIHGAIAPNGLMDVEGDGDVDICSKDWSVKNWNGNRGRMHVDLLENLLRQPGQGNR